jgi:hypothetical protein
MKNSYLKLKKDFKNILEAESTKVRDVKADSQKIEAIEVSKQEAKSY